MEEKTDDSRYVLTQGKNSSQDWIARGQNFMDSRLYDLAAHCYKVAQDPIRFTVASAYGSVQAVRSQTNLTPAQRQQELFSVSPASCPSTNGQSVMPFVSSCYLFCGLHCFASSLVCTLVQDLQGPLQSNHHASLTDITANLTMCHDCLLLGGSRC